MEQVKSDDGARMSLTAHLSELRSRLIKSFSALLAAFLACFYFADSIFTWLVNPLARLGFADLSLIGTGVTEAFFIQLKLALIAAIFLALPVLLWQGWQFVAPGLYPYEKKYARRFVFWGTLFFFLGAWFCYEIVFNAGFRFLLSRYGTIEVRPAIKVTEYLGFASRIVLAFGIIFELPVVIYFLARIGLVDYRFLLRNFRYAVIVVFIVAAVLTPPDIISQILLAVPLLALYGVGIGVAYVAGKKI